jgi:hypothetical protein
MHSPEERSHHDRHLGGSPVLALAQHYWAIWPGDADGPDTGRRERSGSGKTTLAHRIATALACPAICRDEIKEGMARSATRFDPRPGDDLRRRMLAVFFDVPRLLGCAHLFWPHLERVVLVCFGPTFGLGPRRRPTRRGRWADGEEVEGGVVRADPQSAQAGAGGVGPGAGTPVWYPSPHGP